MCEVCAAVGYDIHADGFRVNATTTGDQTTPNIARYADGGFVILYQSSDTPANGIDIRGRWFNGNGATPTTDVLINQTTGGNQTAPAILVNSNGTLSLLWRTPDLLSPGNTQLMVRSFDHGSIRSAESIRSARAAPTAPTRSRSARTARSSSPTRTMAISMAAPSIPTGTR